MSRARTLPEPRYIRPESVSVGDYIRVSWSGGDVDHEVRGRVAYVDKDNDGSTFHVADGGELFFADRRMEGYAPMTYCWDGSPARCRITLLEAAQISQTELFALDSNGALI